MERNVAYQPGTLEGALALIRSGDVIATGMYGNEPAQFLGRLHTIAPRVEKVLLWTMSTMDRYPVYHDASLRGRIDLISYFYSADCRDAAAAGRALYVPMNLHSVGMGMVSVRRPTVFAAAVSPPDGEGNVYLSFDLQGCLECMDHADTVIFEINRRLPRTYGETAIPLSRADYVYEADYPVSEAPAPVSGPISEAIARYAAALIRDGDCIQLGIGGIPNAVGRLLREKNDLGIHSEMLTSTMGELIRAGVATNRCKNIHTGRAVAAFAWGDSALYELLADNPTVEFRRAAYTNDPFVIAQNDNMVSVNTALEIDLTGQICSESIGSRQYTGTGGASDFAYGAYHSRGGRGIIALPSTAGGGTVSRITARLTPGAVVSISRNLADYVVTEYGVARLRDRTIRQRVNALIDIAHPDFRDRLRREAKEIFENNCY